MKGLIEAPDCRGGFTPSLLALLTKIVYATKTMRLK